MDPAVKAKWVAALRSGAYAQGYGKLRTKDRYCSLGVLCKVLGLKIDRAGKYAMAPDGNFRPAIEVFPAHGLSMDAVEDLWEMNDLKGMTFVEIADAIEKGD